MVDYGCMGNMEGHLGNSTPTHWWKSPRWTVIRIEALAAVAIIFSFSLAAFGSCRRWSNSWIVQKGFFVAQVLSLSLGTYSIGLMQSASVKSEMYPIWTVSLFTLFGCIDPVTTYNGLDYKGPLSKVVYGICLNCGYVLLMSISTISNVIGNAAIITLSAITFIKSFHRSFALMEQKKLCHMVYMSTYNYSEAHVFKKGERYRIKKDIGIGTYVSEIDIEALTSNDKVKWVLSCYDEWVALRLSHKLRRYFLGFDYHVLGRPTLHDMDLEWALKVIELELAFVYDAMFTGNPFLHYYQAKTASLWALASFAGICFVLVATAIPEGMTRGSAATGCAKVVGTTTADLAITFGILVSLALLQLTQLVRSWTSNWARAAVVCAYTGKDEESIPRFGSQGLQWGHLKLSGWVRLKQLVATSTNLFDKYLWQDKIGQYSMLPEPRLLASKRKVEWVSSLKAKCERIWQSSANGEKRGRTCVDLVQMFGLHYIWQVILELFSSDTNKRGGVKLDEDVKGSVIDFLGQLDFHELDEYWLSFLPEEPQIRHFLPQFSAPHELLRPEDHCYRYMSCVMSWHIATWYCEVAEHKKQEGSLMSKQAGGGGKEGTKTRDHRRVANALSMYCTYLVKSAPELLPGPVGWAKLVYDRFARDAKAISTCDREDTNTIRRNDMSDRIVCMKWEAHEMDLSNRADHRISNCKALAKLLMHGRSSDELWKTLALVWVQLLVYAAPYGNAEAHMRHLSQGGEFITHLWALLYHLDIRDWKVQKAYHLYDISTVEDAQNILKYDYTDRDIVVVFIESSWLQNYHDDFVTASKLVDGVRFYLTSSLDVAKCLYFPESILENLEKEPSARRMLFQNRADKKITFYDPGEYGWLRNAHVPEAYNPWDVADFVYKIKLASAKARAQETAPSSTSHSPITLQRQRSENGPTVLEITEEIWPPS